MKKSMVGTFFLIVSTLLAADVNYDLAKAADRGDLSGIKRALAAGADVNFRDPYYGALGPKKDTALMKACRRGELDIVQFLFSKKALANLRDAAGDSALRYAVEGGHPEIVSLLFQKGLRLVDNADFKDSLCILEAKGEKRKEIIRFLLGKGVDPKTTSSSGRSLLSGAAFDGDEPFIRELINLGLPVDFAAKDKETPLMIACENGHEAAAAALLELGAEVNARDKLGETALFKAVEKGRFKILDRLLQSGADIEARSAVKYTPLMRAPDYETVVYLLSKGADAFAEEPYGTMLEHFTHEPKIIELFLSKGADPHKKNSRWGETVLMSAAWSGHVESMKLLLARGARVDDVDLDRETALHKAAHEGEDEAVALLLKHGASVDPREQYGVTPLMLAAWRGRTETVELLLKSGADVGTVAREDKLYQLTSRERFREFIKDGGVTRVVAGVGANALVFTFFSKKLEIVKTLVSAGADPARRLNGGVTLPMIAAALGQTDILLHLSEKGADLSAKDDSGMTALAWAEFYKKLETAKAIKAFLKKTTR